MACRDEQRILMFAVFWFGDLSSCFFIQAAKMIEPSSRPCSSSREWRWLLLFEEKALLIWTNLKMRQKEHGWIDVEGHICKSKFLSLQYSSSQDAVVFELCSTRMVLWFVNWRVLMR